MNSISSEIIEAVNSDLTVGDLAEAAINKQNEVRAAAAANGGSRLAELKPGSQTPAGDNPEPKQPKGVKGATKEQIAEINAWDKLYPKKEAV